MENSTEKGGWGTVVSIIIIILILGLGGYYFYSSKLAKNIDQTNLQTASALPSDEIGSIESDLNSINANDLTADTSGL